MPAMPVLKFPDRLAETRRRRRCRPRPGAALAKSLLVLWLAPVLFNLRIWAAMVDSIETETCDEPDDRAGRH